MRARWAKTVGIGIMLLAFGCRTPQPNLKPPPVSEVLNSPPSEKRFDTSTYPREAFNNRDPLKSFNSSQDVVPVRGPSSPSSYGASPAGGIR